MSYNDIYGLKLHMYVLLCFIDLRVRKIRNEASSCPGIFSRTLRFYYVASFPGCDLTLNIIFDVLYNKTHISHFWRNKSHILHHNNVMERSARPIWKVYFESIQVVCYNTASPWQRLVLHPLAVTWRIAEPRYRAPFVFHSTSELGCLLAAMRKQNVYSYWLRLSFLRKHVVAWCHFERAPSFPAHNFFYRSHTDSWLVTNETKLPHPPLFFGSFILCVYKYRYWCCVCMYIYLCVCFLVILATCICDLVHTI